MVTINEYSNNKELWGKVFILKSKDFGIHTFLVSKFPNKNWEDKNIFIDLESEWANTIYYSSVMDDEIIEVFESIRKYYKRYIS